MRLEQRRDLELIWLLGISRLQYYSTPVFPSQSPFLSGLRVAK
jgi:hypothetical protein